MSQLFISGGQNIVVSKKQEKNQINNLTLHLKQLGKEEMKNPRVSSLVAQTVKHLSAMQETQVQPLCQGRFRGEKNGYPLHDSCLENSMNSGTWNGSGSSDPTVHGVIKS